MTAKLSLTDARAIAILCAVMFASGADLLVMTPILPQIARDLSVEVELAGLWVTAYAAATAVFALIFGPISDRFGRRPLLFAGLATLALGTATAGVAGGYTSMMAARTISGVGAGILMTSTTSFVGDHYTDERRAIAMGYVMSGFFLALILAVPIGAALTAWFGWNVMFFVLSGFDVLVLAATLLLPQPAHEQRTASTSIRIAMRGYLGLLFDRRVLGVLVMSASIGMSMTMFSVYTSPWMEETFGLDTAARGMVYAIGGPAVILGGPLSGKLSNAYGRITVLMAGSIAICAVQLAMPFADRAGLALSAALSGDFARFGDVPWPATAPALLAFFIMMIAGSARSTPFQTLALEVVSPEKRGALAALRNSFNQTGSAAGAAIGSAIWAGFGARYLTLCLVASATTAVGAGVIRWLVGADRPE